MLSGKIKNRFKKIPFVWKTFALYVPLFAGIFTFFLFLALYEIKLNTIEQTKSLMLKKISRLQEEKINFQELEMKAEEFQLIIFSLSGQPLIEINRFCSISPLTKLDSFQNFSKEKILLYNTTIAIDNQSFLVQIAKNLTNEEKIFMSMKGFFILILFTGLMISAALSIPITRILLRSVQKITETADQISYDNLTKRLEPSGSGDELDLLTITLNQMIDRIQISADAQKKFVSNASHELRTPIAVIKGYSQLLTRWGSKNPEIIQEAATAIANEIETIESLLQDLLLLAKVDSKLTDLKVEEVNLKNLITETMKDNALLYPNREFIQFIPLLDKTGTSLSQEENPSFSQNFDLRQIITAEGSSRIYRRLDSKSNTSTENKQEEKRTAFLSNDLEDLNDAIVCADKWLLKALLRILTENAIKYTPADTPIEYWLDHNFKTVSLRVVDHGPGIPDLHKEKVFNRFYRLDEDRNREKGGSGLGLPIAKQITTLHKGNISIEDTPGGGTTILLSFAFYKQPDKNGESSQLKAEELH